MKSIWIPRLEVERVLARQQAHLEEARQHRNHHEAEAIERFIYELKTLLAERLGGSRRDAIPASSGIAHVRSVGPPSPPR
jgi:hypothetical protein